MGKFGGHGLSVLENNLSSGKYCFRYARVCGWNNEKAPHSVGKQLHLCHQTSSSVWLE